jgi:hypothetical protein
LELTYGDYSAVRAAAYAGQMGEEIQECIAGAAARIGAISAFSPSPFRVVVVIAATLVRRF